MQHTAHSLNKIYISARALPVQPDLNFAYLRILTALLLLAAIVWTMMNMVQPTHAAETCSSNNCALACNSAKKACSLFPSKSIAAGYARVSYLPFGYRRIRQSSCDKMVCPTFSTTCRRWIPTGKSSNVAP